MISLDNIKTTLNAIKCLLNDYAKKKDVPTKLPNPKPLIFTGAVKRNYNGSKALTVEILSRPDWNQNDSTAPNYIKNRPFYTGDAEIVKIDSKYLPLLPKPDGESYLTFSSKNSFTLKTGKKTWDGTLEYFASDETWTVWDGSYWDSLSPAYSGTEYVLYLRGTGNTVITSSSQTSWELDGSDIACIGNIETLLDYATVESGQHPTMGDYCYFRMFEDCTSLARAPELPATTLSNNCYVDMFKNCTSLTHAPALPATTLVRSCYLEMFKGCTSLAHAPALPATTLVRSCYLEMFLGCTSLTQVPELPATTLADSCYFRMFLGCTSLTKAPELPATTLAKRCYFEMFEGCTSLTQVPELPATTLADSCYYSMFDGCTSLKLSTTKTEEYIQEYRIPFSGNGTDAVDAFMNMFNETGGTFTGTPEINTTYYLSSDNMIARGSEIATLNGYVKNMIDNSVEIPSGGGGGSVPTNVSAFTNDAGYLTLATLPKYGGESV